LKPQYGFDANGNYDKIIPVVNNLHDETNFEVDVGSRDTNEDTKDSE
jgi:hypothetical protein